MVAVPQSAGRPRLYCTTAYVHDWFSEHDREVSRVSELLGADLYSGQSGGARAQGVTRGITFAFHSTIALYCHELLRNVRMFAVVLSRGKVAVHSGRPENPREKFVTGRIAGWRSPDPCLKESLPRESSLSATSERHGKFG
jgi:hypothetical protein